MKDSFQSVVSIFNWYGDMQDDLIPAAGAGHWNDPDMVSEFSLQSMLCCFIFPMAKSKVGRIKLKLEGRQCIVYIDNVLSFSVELSLL